MNNLTKAFEFYDKVVALKWDSDEKLAIGTDHITWVIEAARQAAKDIDELKDEIYSSHNPNTGMECNCTLCQNHPYRLKELS